MSKTKPNIAKYHARIKNRIALPLIVANFPSSEGSLNQIIWVFLLATQPNSFFESNLVFLLLVWFICIIAIMQLPLRVNALLMIVDSLFLLILFKELLAILFPITVVAPFQRKIRIMTVTPALTVRW